MPACRRVPNECLTLPPDFGRGSKPLPPELVALQRPAPSPSFFEKALNYVLAAFSAGDFIRQMMTGKIGPFWVNGEDDEGSP